MTDEAAGGPDPRAASTEGSDSTRESAADGGDDDGAPPARSADATSDDPSVDGTPGGRTVEVPLETYKVVTVFSTLLAVVAVVGGFVLLDVATRRATAAPEDVNVLVALSGLGAIALGAATYAFSTRFRARGMGKPNNGADQPSDDG